EIQPPKITSSTIEEHLYTAGIADPDLIIRTSGEERLSGFLLWQSAYSELYFADVFWPEIRKIDFWRAIRTVQQRDRRFGE
ncbi:MAG: undecaprenyl diphosphate synthase family protein, partial [Promethearchaeota archaeon]